MSTKKRNVVITCAVLAFGLTCLGIVVTVGGFGALFALFGLEPEGLSMYVDAPVAVKAGEEFQIVVTLRNTGAKSIAVDNIEIPVSPAVRLISIDPLPYNHMSGTDSITLYQIALAPGETQVITIGLWALNAGEVAGTAWAWVETRSLSTELRVDIQPAVPIATANETADIHNLSASVVQIIVIVEVEGQGQASWSGSGTIITPDGLILTNAHVVLSDKYYKVQDLIVALTINPDLPPDPRYYAEILQANTVLDIAVLRITTDLDRHPVNRDTLNLPTVRLGDSNALRLGEPLFILGYPGIGGETITLTTGEVGGFTAEAGVGPRAFIKTSATITGGNSGGLAANANGELVGIPTQLGYGGNDQFVDCRVLTDTNRDGIVDEKDNCIPTGGFINALRPVNLAFSSIEAAKRGEVNIASVTGKGIPMPVLGQLLYENDFSYPKGSWFVRGDENATYYTYKDGRYHLGVKPEELFIWSYAGENFSDAVISVDAQVVSPTGEGEYGLICRYQNADNFYVFDVSENGFFSIWKYENGEFVWIRKWEASSAIPTDGRSFKLTVACIGNRLSMAIDGQVLGEAVDASFSDGDIGLAVGTQNTGGLRVAFDNLVVHEPAVTAPPPSGEIAFSDDFSDPGSGWSTYTEDDFATGYSNGGYRIYIQPEYYGVPVLGGSEFKDVQIEVDVTWRTGPVDGEFGLICRCQDGLSYNFIVRGSGLAVISMLTETGGRTEYKWLASTDLGIRISEISGPIRLRADCVGSDLVMYVNGVEVLRAQDNAYDDGYSGLIAGTNEEPELEILFDNFVVYRP